MADSKKKKSLPSKEFPFKLSHSQVEEDQIHVFIAKEMVLFQDLEKLSLDPSTQYI
jgi:hypothetical protein